MVKVKFTLDRRTDGRTDRQTDRQGDSYIPPPNFVCGGYNKKYCEYLDREAFLSPPLIFFDLELSASDSDEDDLLRATFGWSSLGLEDSSFFAGDFDLNLDLSEELDLDVLESVEEERDLDLDFLSLGFSVEPKIDIICNSIPRIRRNACVACET